MWRHRHAWCVTTNTPAYLPLQRTVLLVFLVTIKYNFRGKAHGGTMNRREATAVLREIIEACCELIEMNYVSLKPSEAQIRKNSNDYELYIRCILTNSLRQCIVPILEKHRLRMKELDGAISIYTPK